MGKNFDRSRTSRNIDDNIVLSSLFHTIKDLIILLAVGVSDMDRTGSDILIETQGKMTTHHESTYICKT